MMIVRKAEKEDIERLVPIYEEFVKELGKSMTHKNILNHLTRCNSDVGLLMMAEDKGEPIGIAGGIFPDDDTFLGDVVYIKPKYRKKVHRLISIMIRIIKKTVKYWDMQCSPEKFKLWEKIGFNIYELKIRKEV